MADLTETGRVMAYKRIFNKDNKSIYIDIPCIVQISFNDEGDGQLYDHQFNNTSDNRSRTVRKVIVKHRVFGSDGTLEYDDSNSITVERVTEYEATEQGLGWEIQFTINNNDPAPLPPREDASYDQSKGHKKSHVVRYNQNNRNDPQSAPWVDIELADEVEITGYFPAKDRNKATPDNPQTTDTFQVVDLILNNDPGDRDFNDPDDPFRPTFSSNKYWQDLTDTKIEYLPADTNGGTDADGNVQAVRLDPFQNIVNINWGGLAVEFFDADDGKDLDVGDTGSGP